MMYINVLYYDYIIYLLLNVHVPDTLPVFSYFLLNIGSVSENNIFNSETNVKCIHYHIYNNTK